MLVKNRAVSYFVEDDVILPCIEQSKYKCTEISVQDSTENHKKKIKILICAFSQFNCLIK